MKRAVPYVTGESLAAATDGWLADVRAVTKPRPQLTLRPKRCALLVLDLVRYFADPKGRAFLPAAPAVLPSVLRLVEAFRRTGGPVCFTRHGHDGPEDLGMLGRFYPGDFIREGQPESELIPALVPRPGEAVLRKKTYDAFVGTGLEDWLRARGAEQVLVAGVLTHLCCETTARAAFVRGFEVFFAADATATSNERLHLGALVALADGFAGVVRTTEVEASCAG